ncbi:hypothetical protein [Pseudonocardia spinosispora]|uniref:hypothetical protein n=1 Tax=Pseudonocardia spinosispora TaxID=103441 RepID=UPI00040299B1|nr:hypothetical protein [Pseudonocardia spinosispora]
MRHAGHHRELLAALAEVETATSELRAIATRENTEFLPDAFHSLDQAVTQLLRRFAPATGDHESDDPAIGDDSPAQTPDAADPARPALSLVRDAPQTGAADEPAPPTAVTKLVTKKVAQRDTPAEPDDDARRARRTAPRPRVDPDTVWVDKKPTEGDRRRVLAPGTGDDPLLVGFVKPTYSALGRRSGWQALTDQLIPVHTSGPCRTQTDAVARLLELYLRE